MKTRNFAENTLRYGYCSEIIRNYMVAKLDVNKENFKRQCSQGRSI